MGLEMKAALRRAVARAVLTAETVLVRTYVYSTLLINNVNYILYVIYILNKLDSV